MPPQNQGYPNHPYGTPYQSGPPPVTKRNTVGLVALILAIIGFVFACIPGALIIGWVLLPVAFILGIVGLFQSGKKKGTSLASVIVAAIGTIVGFVVFGSLVSDSIDDTFGGSDLTAQSPSARVEGRTDTRPTSEKGSRQDPLLIGQTVSNKDWSVTLGTPREATAEVASENQFNESPKPGTQFWIVPVTATYLGEGSQSPFSVRVEFVGSDNRTYDDSCGVIPDPINDSGELYKDGTAKGNACVEVPTGADGLWTVTTGFGDPIFFKVP